MHKCGIIGIAPLEGEQNIVPWLIELTHGLQHRGELGAGIAAWTRDQTIRVCKGMGLVREVLSIDRVGDMSGTAGIGHTWYATSTGRDERHAQPHALRHGRFSYNGNLPTYRQILQRRAAEGADVSAEVDTDVLADSIDEGMALNRGGMADVFRHIEGAVDGAFNVTVLDDEGGLFAYRDAHGFHPLSYAIVDGRTVVVASEDSAILDVFPDAHTQDIRPGQLLSVRDGRVTIEQVIHGVRQALCWFEFWYFANRNSTIAGKRVADARYEAGYSLGDRDGTSFRDAIVVPVPDSARRSAQGYADARELEMVEGIVKVRQGRTFIEGREVERAEKAHLKYELIPELLRGRKVILEEDSIVRGTTMQELIARVRNEGGAEEVHVRVAAPPVLSPCFYGLDFPRVEELMTRRNFNGVLEKGELPDEVLAVVAGRLGADSVRYNPVEAVTEILQSCGGLCMACINGRCPTSGGEQCRKEAEAVARRR